MFLLSIALSSSLALPPPNYDKKYVGELYVIELDQQEMEKTCRRRVIACSLPMGDKCIIFMPKGATDTEWQFIFKHEVGHCNGWGAAPPINAGRKGR